MPRATVSVEGERFDLKTCPGGYVVIKRLPFGQFLDRRDMSMGMNMTGDRQQVITELRLANRKTTTYEFGRCITEHNLTDDNDQPLDFKRSDILDKLDPRIGNEIADLIDALHQPMEDTTLPNGSGPPSS